MDLFLEVVQNQLYKPTARYLVAVGLVPPNKLQMGRLKTQEWKRRDGAKCKDGK